MRRLLSKNAISTDRVRKAIRYAFLAPDIVRAIVEGRQPVGWADLELPLASFAPRRLGGAAPSRRFSARHAVSQPVATAMLALGLHQSANAIALHQLMMMSAYRHSGIGLMTPAVVHHGRAEKLTTARRQTLVQAQRAHPERFVRGTPQPPVLPPQAWINPPPEKTTHQEAETATCSGWSIPELPPVSTPCGAFAIEADVDRDVVMSPATPIEAH